MEAYLDNSATTRCSEAACEEMMKVLREDYGNPSSLHMKGLEAEKHVRAARQAIASTLKCRDREIVFTSGGTESNNLAIVGGAMAHRRQGKHIITTPIEHASVRNPMNFLAEQGFEISYLPVDRYGTIDLDALSSMLRKDTILVSIMHVNNEIGTVEPIAEAGKIIKDFSKDILFHVDAIQSYGKFRIYPERTGIDLMSVSGHKIHGPKGSGFLFIRDGVRIAPEILGGGQEGGMRSGTENVPAIAGLGVAAREMYDHFDENTAHLKDLYRLFTDGIRSIEGTHINGRTDGTGASHIVSVSFDDVRAEVLLHALEERGVYVSSGSACSSNRPAVSRTLTATGTDQKYLDATLRFSFSVHTTENEVSYAIGQLRELLPVLRKFTRK